MFAAEED